MKVSSHLRFDGCCEDAFVHYAKVLGGKIETLSRWRDMPKGMPGPQLPAGWEDKVMHAHLTFPGGALRGDDGMPSNYQKPQGFAVNLEAESVAAAEGLFAGLSAGGQVQMPLGETFFAARFVMFTDRFGIPWMIVAGLK